MNKRIGFVNLILAMSLILFSCKNEDHANNPTQVKLDIENVNSTVNTNEIGGKKLKVLSIFKDSASVLNRSYETVVSKKGTQLLIITDENNKVRGLTLSYLENNKPQVLQCDAKSTAYTILLLTPGITVTDPDETRLRFEQFKQLVSVSNFIEFLKSNLKIKALDEISMNQEYQDLLKASINEFYEKYKSNVFKNLDEIQSNNNFDVNKNHNGTITLSNKAYRFVNVYRRDIDNQNKELKVTTVVKPMEGIPPISWGSLLTLSVGKSVDTTDITYNPSSQVNKSEYWIIGPGWKQQTLTPPTSIPTDNLDAIALTYAIYLVLPTIDIVTGGMGMLNLVNGRGTSAYINLIKIIRSAAPSFIKNKPMTDAEILNFLITVGSAVVANFFSNSVSNLFSLIMPYFSSFFGLANITLFTYYMLSIEPVSKFDIPNSQTSFPNITSISPSSGNIGDTVKIIGTNFGNNKCSNCKVLFNNTIAQVNPSDWKDTEIKAIVPDPGVKGKVKVSVIVNGVSSNAFYFTLNQPSTVIGLCGLSIPYMLALGTSIDGNQAHGAQGDYSCTSDIYPNGVRISPSFLEGIVYYDWNCSSVNTITIEIKWVDNAWFNGKKAIRIFNWVTQTWEETNSWDGNDGKEHIDKFNISLKNEHKDGSNRVRVGIWASGSAVIHLAKIQVK